MKLSLQLFWFADAIFEVTNSFSPCKLRREIADLGLEFPPLGLILAQYSINVKINNIKPRDLGKVRLNKLCLAPQPFRCILLYNAHAAYFSTVATIAEQ